MTTSLLPISAADKRRFYYYFQEKNTPNIERFFVFDSSEYRYALNMREVVFHQFLSDGLRPIVDEEDDAYEDGKRAARTVLTGMCYSVG
ncbi:hypothetical protein UQ93_24650, partial [Shigella dysenteriae]